MTDRNIVLIGLMGSGKSMVARELAKRTSRELFSTDVLVEERAGCSINDLVADKGWAYFRQLEHAITQELSLKNNAIIDCGGGIVLDGRNLDLLRKNGRIYFLHAPPDVILARLKGDQSRPLLLVADPQAELTKLYQERLPLYKKADVTLDASDPSIEPVIVQILSGK